MAAKTKQEVEQQSTRDRIWEAMDYGYGKKRDALERSYDKSYSQADRQLLSRGMQRSSYGAQTLANLNQERDRALGDVWSEQIADYQNRLTDQEDKEWERQFRERQQAQSENQFALQFAEGQRQFNEQMAHQKERAAAGDAQWQASFNYQQGRDAVGDAQWQKSFDYQQSRDATSDAQWQQQFDYGKERDTVGDQQWQAQFDEGVRQHDEGMAYQQSRDAVGDAQWREQFDYGKTRDAVSDQQWQAAFDADRDDQQQAVAAEYVKSIISAGNVPSDELLARAGLSRADAEAMIAQAASGGSSGNRGNGGDNPPPADNGDGNDNKVSWQDFINNLSNQQPQKPTNYPVKKTPTPGLKDVKVDLAGVKANGSGVNKTMSVALPSRTPDVKRKK